MSTAAIVLVLVSVMVLIGLDIRRNGQWDPWADFGPSTGWDDGRATAVG